MLYLKKLKEESSKKSNKQKLWRENKIKSLSLSFIEKIKDSNNKQQSNIRENDICFISKITLSLSLCVYSFLTLK